MLILLQKLCKLNGRGGDNLIEQDTIRLLRECDAGVKMGIEAINEVLDKVSDDRLKQILTKSKHSHGKLDENLQQLLDKYGDEGKNPPAMVQGMSKIKTEIMLTVMPNDSKAAKLITDGCHMGVDSLNKYLNQYKAADEDSKIIANELIALVG